MKTYVITLSERFMKGHPQCGEETGFAEKFATKTKIHTIRANYDYWARVVKEIQERKAILSVRQWSGVPYRSSQIVIRNLTKESGIGIQRISMSLWADGIHWQIDGGQVRGKLSDIAANDGLSHADFIGWFFPNLNKVPTHFDGGIIHFTHLRY